MLGQKDEARPRRGGQRAGREAPVARTAAGLRPIGDREGAWLAAVALTGSYPRGIEDQNASSVRMRATRRCGVADRRRKGIAPTVESKEVIRRYRTFASPRRWQ
jgi:hypothetical protein